MAEVALAGPLADGVLGAEAEAIRRINADMRVSLAPPVAQFLQIFLAVNFGLAAFNMIPLPPLDGSRILHAFLPTFWRPVLAPLERYGIPVLFLLILIGGGMGASIITAISGPVYQLLMRIFVGS
jgi:Zn-dependent protease